MDDLQKDSTPQLEFDSDFKLLFKHLTNFLTQSLSKEISLKTSGYLKKFKNLDVKVSFGKGNFSVVPWICFLKPGEDIQDGYYPGLYFDRDLSKLFVVLGISETKVPKNKWPTELTNKYKKFGETTISENIKHRFPSTFLYSQFDIDNNNIEQSLISQKERLSTDLSQIIQIYQNNNERRRYWQIAPNAQASAWDLCLEKGIIPIYFNEYLKNITDDIVNFDESQLTEFCRNNNPTATVGQVSSNVELIWAFLHDINVGDYVLSNKGKKIVLGWGIISSPVKIAHDSNGISFYREVNWKDPALNRDITYEQGKNFFKTLTEMTESEFESIVNNDKRNNPYKMNLAKQIILYGPPGTGKTFNTIIRAHEIIFGVPNESITYRTLVDKLQTQSEGKINLSQMSWLEAILLAFDELKPKDKVLVDDIKKTKIIQEFSTYKNNRSIIPTIWYILQTNSREDSETVKIKKKSGREFFDKDENSNWFLTDIGKSALLGFLDDIKEIPKSSTQFRFITFHQSFSYEDFVEGIRPIVDAEESSQISYEISNGIFKDICINALNDPDNNYVLIIDEINRGNISKIFGELITLLEDNKRKGETEEITVKLPYSGDDFCVPNNVYIIGTMNSTDKSIALVDIALRRRFHFERLNVDYNRIQNETAKWFLRELNLIICSLKNSDFEIGHAYFMNIPIDDERNSQLKSVFSNQIIPLLEEYFFNDWEALATILGSDAIQIERRKKLVWDDDTGEFKKDTGDYDKIFGRCLKPTDVVFESAMKHLHIQTTQQNVTE